MLSSSKLERSTPSSRIFSAKQQLQRKRPSRVELDSQHLFQQSLKLGNELDRLLEENRLLKKGLHKVDSVRNYKQGLIFSVENIIKEKSKEMKSETKSSSWLVYNLKKKINQMKKELEMKEKEIEDFGSSKIALTLKEKEAQAEILRALAEKHYKDETGSENEILDELIEMRLYNELQNQCILELNSNISAERSNTKRLLEDISNAKKELEIRKQQNENNKKIEEMSRMEKEMERVQTETEEAGESEEVIEELELTRKLQAEKIKVLETKINKIIERENLEKKRLEGRIEDLKKRIRNGQKPAEKVVEAEVEDEIEIEQNSEVESVKAPPAKVVTELKLKDVEHIGEDLKYKLSIKRCSHPSWKPLITSTEDELTISILQLTSILQQQPFSLDHDDCFLLSRYLVEEATGKYLYDQNLRQDIPIVKSILQKLISNLIVYTPEEQTILTTQVADVTQKYHLLLVGALETKTGKKDFIHKNQILPVFDACSMEFTAKEMEFIYFYLYGFSEHLSKLMYRNLVKIGVEPVRYWG